MPARYCPHCFKTFKTDGPTCPSPTCAAPRPHQGWSDVLEPGDLLDRHYRIDRVLAVAGAGLTYKAQEVDADDQLFGPELAIKVLYTQSAGRQLQRLSTEAQILQAFTHENLVELRGFVNRAGSAPYLVTLFERGGNLREHITEHGQLSPQVSAGIIVQILSALAVTHQRNIVHRDLKPDNILLRQPTHRDTIPRIRVADFGVAKVRGGASTATIQGAFLGTPEYAAPEQFAGKLPTPATDVFAVGCLFIECLTGSPPVVFDDRSNVEACALAWAATHPYQVDAEGPAAMRELIQAMLAPRPNDRPEIPRLLRCLAPLTKGLDPLELVDPRPSTPAPPPTRSGVVLAGIGVMGMGSLVVSLVLCGAVIGAAIWGFGYLDEPPTVVINRRPSPASTPGPRPPG